MLFHWGFSSVRKTNKKKHKNKTKQIGNELKRVTELKDISEYSGRAVIMIKTQNANEIT